MCVVWDMCCLSNRLHLMLLSVSKEYISPSDAVSYVSSLGYVWMMICSVRQSQAHCHFYIISLHVTMWENRFGIDGLLETEWNPSQAIAFRSALQCVLWYLSNDVNTAVHVVSSNFTQNVEPAGQQRFCKETREEGNMIETLLCRLIRSLYFFTS